MTTFITGGTGKTGSKIAKLLHAANYPVLIASRSGVAPEPFKAVKFDWFDEKTFAAPFEVDPNINKVYLVLPSVFESLAIVKPFIDLAISKGVKRFVMNGSSVTEKGGMGYGKVHEYLADIGVDYAIMRNSWFMVDDIAKASYDALVAEKGRNTDFYVVGPQLYTHDEVAALLSAVLGRKITHKRISEEEFSKIFQSFGRQAEYAGLLAWVQTKIAAGEEEALFSSSKSIIGNKTLRDYLEANKKLWVKV
ncbi:hypothetical protein BDZ97DRAFT_1754133 [Flammula alnicola]|nr:hypothetical protein BDZ97DRAFT_1754133 [Flammula alnicola]